MGSLVVGKVGLNPKILTHKARTFKQALQKLNLNYPLMALQNQTQTQQGITPV